MSTRETLHRYTIIINRLRQSPATFNEIADKLEFESGIHGYNFNISKRTFQRDIIYSIFYNSATYRPNHIRPFLK